MKTKIRSSIATKTICSYLQGEYVIILYNVEYFSILKSKVRQRMWRHELMRARNIIEASDCCSLTKKYKACLERLADSTSNDYFGDDGIDYSIKEELETLYEI